MKVTDLKSLRSPLAGLLAGAGLTALALGAPSHAFDPSVIAAPASTAQSASPSLADIVERVSPSVVQIFVQQGSSIRTVETPDAELPPGLREFFGPDLRGYFSGRPNFPHETPQRAGSGSGFFIEGGYIVTNNHVVDNAKTLRVRFDSGEEVEGTLVGTDPKTDLAVVKVDAKSARPPLVWGDSSRSRAGDNVFTIGSPFSLGNTVTAGIISARGRDIQSGPYDDYFQIDAPINPGNSGGPMFNAAGEVIGVNSAIYSPSGGNVGVGFSIPSDQAKAVVRQIIDHGFVERGWLGVSIQRLTPEIARSLGLQTAKGAFVADVSANSPAAKAGLKPMDVVIAYDGRPIADMHDLTRAVAETRPGASRDLKVSRDGRERLLHVRIEALDTPAPRRLADSARETPLDEGIGLAVAESARGLVIADVADGSPAHRAGLRIGDRILAIGGIETPTAKDAQSAVGKATAMRRGAVLVQVERDNASLFVGVPLA